MKITRWLLAAILFFKITNLVSLSLTHFLSPISVSSLHISAMADNWFTVMAKGAAKKVLPTFYTPTASLPVSVLLPATKDLLGTLGLETVPAPMDGSCLLHCAVHKLKEADSETYAAMTHDSLRGKMCAKLLTERHTYQPHHVGDDASFTRYVEKMMRPKEYVDHLGKFLSKP